MDKMNPSLHASAAVPTAIKTYTSADAIACLRAAGVPVTHQRIEIARALFSAPVHLSADQIWANVREHAPDVPAAIGLSKLDLAPQVDIDALATRAGELLRALRAWPDQVPGAVTAVRGMRVHGDAVLVSLKVPRSGDVARLEGRLRAAAISYEVKVPPIWSDNSYHMELLVKPARAELAYPGATNQRIAR